jgi:peroxiredoxin
MYRNAYHATAFVAAMMASAFGAAEERKRPEVGMKAADFELADVAGSKHQLSTELQKGPVVLMVLRGYPGYQCPVCNRQVGQFLEVADKLKAKGATVLMIYPGPSKELQKRASEFISGKSLPDRFHLLIDPDYSFTDAYDLRWDARNETAYPSTFVLGKDGKVLYAKISMTHGDRAEAGDVLKALP